MFNVNFQAPCRTGLLACATAVLLLGAGVASAQTVTSTTKKPPAAAATAKPKPKAATVSAAKPKAARTVKAAPVPTKPAEAVAHLPLSTAQQAIASSVLVGKIPCELGQVVEINPMEGMTGFFKLTLGKLTYTLAPEETTTGAVRLEDRANGMVWLQLVNKSMLMNHKLGRRMADECMSPSQLLVAQEMQRNPPPSLLDAPPPKPAGGTSMAPAQPAQAAAAP